MMLTTLLRALGLYQDPAPTEATFARESPRRPRNGYLTRAPRWSVLMLDIDGVLHPCQAGTLIYLPALEKWLRAHQAVDIVISSNWRDTHSLDELRALFSEDLRNRVIGTTPNLNDQHREDEILVLVAEYGIERWAAVDDRPQEFPRTAATHLVATRYHDGLTAESFVQLTQKLCPNFSRKENAV